MFKVFLYRKSVCVDFLNHKIELPNFPSLTQRTHPCPTRVVMPVHMAFTVLGDKCPQHFLVSPEDDWSIVSCDTLFRMVHLQFVRSCILTVHGYCVCGVPVIGYLLSV